MIKDVTLGQYFPGKSIIHKLDPRVKVLLTLVNIVFIFIAGNFSSLGLMTVFTLVAMLLSGVPLPDIYEVSAVYCSLYCLPLY